MSAPNRNQIKIGARVSIETKKNQGTGKLTEGTVKTILTSSQIHPHGIKVSLEGGQIGRVKQLEDQNQTRETNKPIDLDKIEIPKTEDASNEFKEFYQYDKKIPNTDDKQAIGGIKRSVQERFATAVCSFGNSYEGGFVYLGINSDGVIVGLEQDMKLGKFSDYSDSFANHIVDKLEDLLKDKVFVTSKIRIKFRQIENKTICIVHVLPADRPIYLHTKSKTFFVRGPAPKAVKFDMDQQFKYIKERFPRYG